MEIRKIGPQPEDNFFILPNVAIRDTRLSRRARGLMAEIGSHATGFHISSEELARTGPEGIKAIRAAMNELVTCGYMRRVRSQNAQGQWRTDIDLYVYGNAPALPDLTERDIRVDDDDFTDEPFGPVGEPTSLFRPSVNGEAVHGDVEEHQSENHPSTSPSAAAGSHLVGEGTSSSTDGVSQLVTPPFPTVEQRKLVDWFSVPVTSAPAWVAAWETAHAVGSPTVEYDPQAHLAIYLSRCREERRQPRSDLWLRFFIEDRAKHIVVLREEAAQVDHHHETPQEREDRLNRRLPPAEWGVTAAATEGEQA